MGETLFRYFLLSIGVIEMFYVKEPLTDAVNVTVEIRDDNVFCQCPVCGKELAVDLQDILMDGDADLFGTTVLCDECVKKWMKEHGKRSDA